MLKITLYYAEITTSFTNKCVNKVLCLHGNKIHLVFYAGPLYLDRIEFLGREKGQAPELTHSPSHIKRGTWLRNGSIIGNHRRMTNSIIVLVIS